MKLLPPLVAILLFPACALAQVVGSQVGGGPNVGAAAAASSMLNVTDYGMSPGNGDNAPFISRLETANVLGGAVWFPPAASGSATTYYFSTPFSLSTGGSINCGGSGIQGNNQTTLVFAAGVDGFIHENARTSSLGTYGAASINGCKIMSLGRGSGKANASGTMTDVAMPVLGSIPRTTWNAGDGIIVIPARQPPNSALTIPPGAYIDSVSGTTLNIHAGFWPTASGDAVIFQLPASQKLSVTTTSGSNKITVTGGPRLLQPGDVIWSDAFPFGSTILNVSGGLESQTANVGTFFLTAPVNASATHANGLGQLWIVPAGIKRRMSGKAVDNYIANFPIDLQMACSAHGAINCTNSYDEHNMLVKSLVGRWVTGNNAGGSVANAEIYTGNSMTDIAEAGTVGSTYIGEGLNSAEAGTSIYGVVVNCFNQNYSAFIGGYMTGITNVCLSSSGVGAATTTQSYSGIQFLNPVNWASATANTLFAGRFWGSWAFGAEPGASTPCTSFSDAALTRYHSIQTWSPNCGSAAAAEAMSWNAANRTLGFSAFNGSDFSGEQSVSFQNPYGYGGYRPNSGIAANVMFSHGFMLAGGRHSAIGDERYFQLNSVPPTTGEQGDVVFNARAAAGRTEGWVDTAPGDNWRPFGLIANDQAGKDWTIPQTLRSGSSNNTDLTGRITLSGGAATYSLTGSYASPPNCITADVTTPGNVNSVIESTTNLTFKGTGSDVLKWICVGRN